MVNNSRFAIESVQLDIEQPKDVKPLLREREAKIVRTVEALQEVSRSKGWSSLKTELFDDLAGSLTTRLHSEAKKESPDTNKLNRLAGELKWAERFSNLQKLEQEFKEELKVIKSKLYGTS